MISSAGHPGLSIAGYARSRLRRIRGDSALPVGEPTPRRTHHSTQQVCYPYHVNRQDVIKRIPITSGQELNEMTRNR